MQSEADLSFRKGDDLWLLKKELGSQWWVMRNGAGQEGAAPSNYLTRVEGEGEAKGRLSSPPSTTSLGTSPLRDSASSSDAASAGSRPASDPAADGDANGNANSAPSSQRTSFDVALCLLCWMRGCYAGFYLGRSSASSPPGQFASATASPTPTTLPSSGSM